MDLQLVVLGTGEERYENMFRHFAWKYQGKVSANIYYSEAPVSYTHLERAAHPQTVEGQLHGYLLHSHAQIRGPVSQGGGGDCCHAGWNRTKRCV